MPLTGGAAFARWILLSSRGTVTVIPLQPSHQRFDLIHPFLIFFKIIKQNPQEFRRGDGKMKALAPNFGAIDDENSVQVSGVIQIPTRCVLNVTPIAEISAS